ncbi:hypothetical protein PHMEG_00014862 [Phytophthora megakarya]|uniref:Uncharacterized protein n=1 Tax=Phytophthora megakarya TaxID=4795 RepID=A0A225W590_9STRA|nr:hypothetical protein PHMEG_00014862 [Phytophthora megakarya]
MKNDQDGTRSRDARHVYANPFISDICPLRSLVIYTAVGVLSVSRIFPGGNQYDGLSKSSTFVSSCSNGGSSAAAICIRAGWKLSGVQGTYIRYEAAGDRIVGCYVDGMPFDDTGFVILPHFS